MNRTDTIIAPATPPGEGGLAVIRLSGPGARQALEKFFQPSGDVPSLESHHLYHGHLTAADGRDLDEVMAVYMQPPRSYTCEDVVEIHCHGGQQVVRSILDLYLASGLRLAQPGEFTYRAFMNGRIDLAQAEAVSRLIHSRSDSARALALSQVEGRLSRTIHHFTETLRGILVLVEAWIDFPEEDLPEEETLRIKEQVSETIDEITTLLDSYHTGKVLVEGMSILLIGRPNAGKSSLMNALLGEERAIVTDIPGTTRDTLEEGVTIGGIPVRLVDTAGFRQSEDLVEMEGVRRAREKIASADLVLLLVDGSQPVHDEDLLAYEACREKDAFLVVTKNDLVVTPLDTGCIVFPRVDISTKTEEGLAVLREKIVSNFTISGDEHGETVMVAEKRHNDALQSSLKSLQHIDNSIEKGFSLEFLAVDLREALAALGAISGETTSDEILGEIFSSFCIGK